MKFSVHQPSANGHGKKEGGLWKSLESGMEQGGVKRECFHQKNKIKKYFDDKSLLLSFNCFFFLIIVRGKNKLEHDTYLEVKAAPKRQDSILVQPSPAKPPSTLLKVQIWHTDL